MYAHLYAMYVHLYATYVQFAKKGKITPKDYKMLYQYDKGTPQCVFVR